MLSQYSRYTARVINLLSPLCFMVFIILKTQDNIIELQPDTLRVSNLRIELSHQVIIINQTNNFSPSNKLKKTKICKKTANSSIFFIQIEKYSSILKAYLLLSGINYVNSDPVRIC